MPAVYPNRRSNKSIVLITALVLICAVSSFVLVRKADHSSEGASSAGASPAIARATLPQDAVASSPMMNVASPAAVATQTSQPASRPSPAWQASVKPAVVAATRVDSLATYQVQMERWTCTDDHCDADFRIPPTVEASGKLSSAAQMLDTLQKKMAKQNIDVALNSIQPGPQGLAVSMDFTPSAATPRKEYSSADIAAIRLESYQQGHGEQNKGSVR